ncbi:sporulation integral membrane protein YlbJ [Bacillus sp. DTU_2020_1000418_1_SI_GHA_SEK_038]|uniref:sporulation integral membrane protein YlbJ n=1 Tax=Bacillus sp. DTU_2020_1000418_1_SI_GHA_SEK_038 TaxID=3077585 RepID=UPI0028EFDBE7|nr:sporulation integral membrane protein YlbJ [Bacillus sp. DTU_2020_1000418_1_SI_GHA_SEK_038]WNS77061.1 sporulation integral membrane protein YlbJ [Bacillus sp. DTU_2020_1000418_1_SI_GHA_SEK_038]
MLRSKLKTIILALSVTMMAISLISFPQESVDASIRGLNMWWEIVFPSLLPFFIVSEMLIGFGVVRFIGVLLEPLMRPLFKVPGVGGFVWAMGMASGFPAGAKLTARLRQEGQISKTEAERLVSFTNCSNPLFIFGAVSVGFFHNAKLGVILALAHYLGNITVGLLMRFYGRKEETTNENKQRKPSIRYALSVLHRTRINDNRPIGKLLGDAVMSSIRTLLMIGGFIILFSVINKLLYHLGITTFLAGGLEIILSAFNLPIELSTPFISGIFEITLGSQMTSQVQEATLMHQAIITSFVLAFSGFSVQAQVASILAQTDIDFKPFFIARILQGFFAAIYAALLWNPVYERFYNTEQPSNAVPVAFFGEGSWMHKWFLIMSDAGPLITIFALLCYTFLLARRLGR